MTLLCYCWNLFVFVLVSVSSQFWSFVPNSYWLAILPVLCVLTSRSKISRWIPGAILAFVSVTVHLQMYHAKVDALFHAGENITITGHIDSYFKQISHGYDYSFTVDQINGQSLGYFVRPTVRLIVTGDEILHPGSRWKFDVRLKPVCGKLNEAGFDLERYYASQGWTARAVAKDAGEKLSASTSFRNRLYSRVESLAGDLQYYGIIKALSFGVRNEISPSLWNSLKNSGLSHLIAISGLHIGIAFFIGWNAGQVLRLLFFRLLPLPVISGLILAFVYAWLAGFSITTQRAFTMCTILVMFELMGFSYSRWFKLLLTLSVLLFIDPISAMSASFWLSFNAVAAVYIVMFHPRVTSLATVKKMVIVQVALIAMMVPVSLLVFGGFSLVAPLYNIWCVPYFSFVVIPAIFVALLCSAIFSDFAVYLWPVADFLLEPVILSLGLSERGWLSVPVTYQIPVILIFILFVFSPLIRCWQKLVALLATIAWLLPEGKPENWRLDILDVGQGLALLISKGEETLLYDTGNQWESGSMAESVIAPVLRRRGINRLDGLILSHMDSDHAGGKAFVESEYKPRLMRSSQKLFGYLPCVKGERWEWQLLSFEVLWPPTMVSRAHNPHSCVIRISDSVNSLLLTGDIEKVSEYLLVKGESNLKANVMIVPHHGSNTSSSPAFLDKVQPELAIASLAKGNQWGMPDYQLVDRYRQRSIQWIDTGDSGQVSIFFSANGWRVEKMRKNQSDAWYRQMLRKGVE